MEERIIENHWQPKEAQQNWMWNGGNNNWESLATEGTAEGSPTELNKKLWISIAESDWWLTTKKTPNGTLQDSVSISHVKLWSYHYKQSLTGILTRTEKYQKFPAIVNWAEERRRIRIRRVLKTETRFSTEEKKYTQLSSLNVRVLKNHLSKNSKSPSFVFIWKTSRASYLLRLKHDKTRPGSRLT